jgi:hypothetical protein
LKLRDLKRRRGRKESSCSILARIRMAVAMGPWWFGKREARREVGLVDSATAFWSVLEEGRVESSDSAFWY